MCKGTHWITCVLAGHTPPSLGLLAECAITFSEVKVKSLSHVRRFATLWTVAHQAPPSTGFSRQEYWSGLPFPSPMVYLVPCFLYMGFPYSSVGKESACNAGDPGLIPGLGRSPEEGKGYPLQYSGLENSVDSIVHGVSELDTTEQLSLSLLYLEIKSQRE